MVSICLPNRNLLAGADNGKILRKSNPEPAGFCFVSYQDDRASCATYSKALLPGVYHKDPLRFNDPNYNEP